VLHRILLAACALAASAPIAHAAPPTRIAILPVVIHSLGDESYLREGLADMLASRLGQSPALSVVRVEDPEQATTDLARARAAARGAGADYVLFGSFTHFGEGASLDLSCARVAEEDAAVGQVFIQTGTIGEIIPKLDELARRVSAHVAGGGAVTPPVSAGPPAGGSSLDVLDALSELESLSDRVEGLERRVFEGGSAQTGGEPGADGGSNGGAGAGSEAQPR
jgi:TolB-like protein